MLLIQREERAAAPGGRECGLRALAVAHQTYNAVVIRGCNSTMYSVSELMKHSNGDNVVLDNRISGECGRRQLNRHFTPPHDRSRHPNLTCEARMVRRPVCRPDFFIITLLRVGGVTRCLSLSQRCGEAAIASVCDAPPAAGSCRLSCMLRRQGNYRPQRCICLYICSRGRSKPRG